MNDLKIRKVLIFSSSFPPTQGGTGTIMSNLFTGVDTSNLEVVTSFAPELVKNEKFEKMYRLSKTLSKNIKFIWRISVIEETIRYFIKGMQLTQQKKYDKILFTYAGTPSFLGGYFVALFRKIKFDIYIIDLISDSRIYLIEKYLLQLFEKTIIDRCCNAFVLTEAIAEFYSKTIKRKYTLIPHCLSLDSRLSNNQPDVHNISGDIKIVMFSGQIHEISLDALQQLPKAIKMIKDYDIILKIYTNRPKEYLERMGLIHSFTEIEFISDRDELYYRIKEADILYSPVSFFPKYKYQAETCFPTKTFDYIRAGKPILVHAPAHYHYTRYMGNHNSALIVSGFDPESLRKGITDLLSNVSLQNSLVNNAKRMAENNHGQKKIQRLFFSKMYSS